MTRPLSLAVYDIAIRGGVVPVGPDAALLDLQLSAGDHRPTRPLAGWLATYAELRKGGDLVPVQDRDGHVFEAAGDLERIDWTPYASHGLWNDTHRPIYVGVPTFLDFCGPKHDLAMAHGKVGFFTAGHLWDRNDPRSWLDYAPPRPPSHKGAVPRPDGPGLVPTREELDRADHFQAVAVALAKAGRPIGFSAHGQMALSPCGTRIVWARLTQGAVCELPKNPQADAYPVPLGDLRKAVDPAEVLQRRGMVGRAACRSCSCPPNACNGLLRKAAADLDLFEDFDLPQLATDGDKRDRCVRSIMALYDIPRVLAEGYVDLAIANHTPSPGVAA